jgi:6-phosphogluconolactonase
MRIFFLLLFFHILSSYAFCQSTYMVVGSYTDSKPMAGIHVYSFNNLSGATSLLCEGKDLVNPSFLTLSKNGKSVYACTESRIPNGGNLTTFTLDVISKKISQISKETSGGENPAYVSISPDQKFAFVANYNGGSLSVYSINTKDQTTKLLQTLSFAGSSVNIKRQEKSHIHSAELSPDQKYLFTPDLGSDLIRVFRFDKKSLTPLTEITEKNITTTPGSGPRHLIFHPNKKWAYCVEEMAGRVSAYSYKNGILTRTESYNTYKNKFDEYSGADVHLSPDGKFLYVSNRLETENTIAIYKVADKSGALELIGHESTYGNQPRNFAIDPSGRFLTIANVLTNNIAIFKRDLVTGLLSKIDNEINMFNPSCIKFFEIK